MGFLLSLNLKSRFFASKDDDWFYSNVTKIIISGSDFGYDIGFDTTASVIVTKSRDIYNGTNIVLIVIKNNARPNSIVEGCKK